MQDLRRPVGVVVVCGFYESGSVYIAALNGLCVGGPSLYGSGGGVDGCSEHGLWGGSRCFVGQGLVHVFVGYTQAVSIIVG